MTSSQGIGTSRMKSARRHRRLRPNFFWEPYALEDRTLLSGTVTVSTTNDMVDGTVTSISALIASPGADGKISLREAIEAAENTPSTAASPNIINLPDGTYNLTTGTAGTGGTAELGILNGAQNLSTQIVGTSQAGTIINQTISGARIFDIDLPANGNTVFSASNMTLENGTSTDGGGAVLMGGQTTDQVTFTNVLFQNNKVTGTATNAPGGAINDAGGILTITNCTFDNNTVGTVGGTNLGSGSGAIDLFPLCDSTLIITGSTFSNNKAAASAAGAGGGAIRAATNGFNVSVNISTSTFTNNQVTNGSTSGGGAIYMPSGALTVSDSTFTGNQITNSGAGENAGGAIYAGGSLTATFNRFVGNSTAKAGAGNEISFNAGNAGTVNITNNWWGSNSGPAAGDNVQTSPSATLAPPHWLVLTNSANPNTLNIGDSATLTADFKHNEAGTDVSASDPDAGHTLPAFIGLPVTYGLPVDGTLSNQQTTIQSGGTATATYTATSPGSGSSTATVDGVTATANITNNAPALFADLALTITDGKTTYVPGGTTVYTLTVSNAGPDAVTGASVVDNFPAIVVSANWSAVGAGGGSSAAPNGSGNINTTVDLPAGASVTFTISALTAASATTNLSNTASISAPAGVTDPNPANNSGTDNDTPAPQADLSVSKSDSPDPVLAGTNLTYTVTVGNNGPSDAQSVSLSDAVPANTTLVSVSVPPGWTETDVVPVGGSGTLTFTDPTLAAGTVAQFTIIVHVNASTTNNTVLSNTATATTTTPDPNIGTNGTATATTTVNTQADIAVTKTGPATVVAGTQITYTVTVANNGPSDAQNVALADTLPGAIAFVSQSQPGSGPQFSLNHTGNAINDTIATLAAGASQTFTIIASVPASTSNGLGLSNTATGSSTTTDGNPGNESSTASTTVSTQADLVVTSTGPLSALAGTDLTYSITVTNNGPSDAQNTALVDTIPDHTTQVSLAQNTGPALGGTLPAGQTQTFTLIVHAAADTPNGTVVTNKVDVGSATTDNDPTTNSSSFQTVINTSADLVVTKTGPASTIAGNQITYTVTVTNNGPSDAQDVALADTFPSGLSFVTQSQPGSGPQFSLSNTANSINDTIATLAAGASQTFTVIALVGASASAGTYSNTATVSTSTNDPDPANSSTASTTVTTQADLAVVKTGPTTVIAGTDITYSITVTNNGPSDAQAAAVNDVLPTGTTFVSFVQDTGSPDGTTLAAGATRTFTLIAHIKPDVSEGTVITNTASASTTTTDPNPNNDSSSVDTTVHAQADLAVVKTGPTTGIAGTDITYAVTVTNNGPSDAQAAAVNDVLPTGTTFVSFVQDTGSPDGTTLAAGGTRTFTLIAHIKPSVPHGTIITNTASASSTTTDPNPTNDSSSFDTVVIAQADLSITKSGPAQVNAGDPAGFDYTLTVTNNGPSDNAGGFTVSDVLPTGFSFQSGGSTAGGSVLGQTVSYTNAAGLAAGASQTFVLHVTVATSVPDMTTVHNTGSVATNGTTDPNSSNNVSNTVDTLVRAGADLAITKAGPATAVAGDLSGFNYTLVVTNTGFLDNVGGFTVTDVLPAGLTFQAAGSTAGALVIGQTVSFTNTTGLANGASQTFTIHVRLSPSAPNGVILSNSASVVSNGTVDPYPSNNTSNTLATTVQTRADLALTSAVVGLKPTGQMQTFTLTLTNNGPSDAQNVVLTDALPANTMLVAETQDSGPAFMVTPGTSGGVVTLTFTRPTLAAGATATFTFVSRLTSPQPDGTGLSDIANVSSSTVDPNPLNNQAVAKALLSNKTDLALSVTPSVDPVNPGGKEVFTLTVTNNGPNDAQNVVLSDTLPTNATLKFLGQTSGPTFSVAASPIGSIGGSIQWSIPTLAMGQSATFLILVTPTGGARFLTNTATVTSGTVDVNPSNNSVKTTVTVGAGQTASVVKGVATPAAMTKGSTQAFDAILHQNANLVHHTLRGRGRHRRHRHV